MRRVPASLRFFATVVQCGPRGYTGQPRARRTARTRYGRGMESKGLNVRFDDATRQDLETIRKRQPFEIPLAAVVRRAVREFIDRELGDDPERRTGRDDG